MPNLIPIPCKYPRCNELVHGGSLCSKHRSNGKKKSNFSRELSRHQRGYGTIWDKLRKVILARDCGLCQECLRNGVVTPGNIVDHIQSKSEGGSDDPENLRVICKRCHDLKTATESARGGYAAASEPKWLPESKIPVFVVCGPPGSGKGGYVEKNSQPGDLILDLDEIASELFSLPLFHANFEQRMAALRYRNKRLAMLGDDDCSYRQAWLIVTAGRPESRDFWRRKYRREPIIIAATKQQCVDRVKSDPRRPEISKKRIIEAIYQWI